MITVRTQTLRNFFIVAMFVGLGTGQASADQVHNTVAVAGSGQSAAINIFGVNTPVIITCTQTVVGNVGTGQITANASSTDNGLIFNGYDISGIITNGQSVVNAHLVWCDFGKQVELRALNSHQIVIKNNTSSSQTVVVMQTY